MAKQDHPPRLLRLRLWLTHITLTIQKPCETTKKSAERAIAWAASTMMGVALTSGVFLGRMLQGTQFWSRLDLTKQKPSEPPEFVFSLIIPTLNSSLTISQVLCNLCHGLEHSGCQAEIIVVDGGSRDETIKIVQRIQEAWTRLGFIQQEKQETPFTGRIRRLLIVETKAKDVYQQCHEGTKYAHGSIVCFIPDDALMPPHFPSLMLEALNNPSSPVFNGTNYKTVVGCFPVTLNIMDTLYEPLVSLCNFRARYLQLPTLDHGLFMKISTYYELGGFQGDLSGFMSCLLRTSGRVVMVNHAIVLDAQRWLKTVPFGQYLEDYCSGNVVWNHGFANVSLFKHYIQEWKDRIQRIHTYQRVFTQNIQFLWNVLYADVWATVEANL